MPECLKEGVINITNEVKYPRLKVIAPEGVQGAQLRVQIDTPEQLAELNRRLSQVPEGKLNIRSATQITRDLNLQRADT